MEKRTIPVVCFFCHDGQGNYLLGRRSLNDTDEPGTWSPGAGGVEFGEGIEDALHRELREEYGVQPLDREFLGYRDYVSDKGNHMIVFDFKVLVDPSVVKNNEPEACEELRWITISNLDAFDGEFHPQMSVFMNMHRHKLI